MDLPHKVDLDTRFSVPLETDLSREVYVTMIPCMRAQVEEVNMLIRDIYRELLDDDNSTIDWHLIMERDEQHQVAKGHAENVLEMEDPEPPEEVASPFIEIVVGTIVRHAILGSSLNSAPCRHVRDSWGDYSELKGNMNLSPLVGYRGLIPYWLNSPKLGEVALMLPSAAGYH